MSFLYSSVQQCEALKGGFRRTQAHVVDLSGSAQRFIARIDRRFGGAGGLESEFSKNELIQMYTTKGGVASQVVA